MDKPDTTTEDAMASMSLYIRIKNYRNVSNNSKYENETFRFSKQASSIHPHQVHLEFLAETGLFGYISFIIFIISLCILVPIYENNGLWLSFILFLFLRGVLLVTKFKEIFNFN